jgi:hypothetical protein
MEPKYHTLFQALIIVLTVMALPERYDRNHQADDQQNDHHSSTTPQAPSQDRMMASN